MNITADTNLLVRVLTEDDPDQAAAARQELAGAELVAVPIPVLCELVWVLLRGYRLPGAEIAAALRTLLAAASVRTETAAVEAGLSLLEAGGDFADGAIAQQGQVLVGGAVFVSFDADAVARLAVAGFPARAPSLS